MPCRRCRGWRLGGAPLARVEHAHQRAGAALRRGEGGIGAIEERDGGLRVPGTEGRGRATLQGESVLHGEPGDVAGGRGLLRVDLDLRTEGLADEVTNAVRDGVLDLQQAVTGDRDRPVTDRAPVPILESVADEDVLPLEQACANCLRLGRVEGAISGGGEGLHQRPGRLVPRFEFGEFHERR